MTSIDFAVEGTVASATLDGVLTAGAVGIPVNLSWDADWDDLVKTLVCQSGTGKHLVLRVEDTAVVPPAALRLDKFGRNTLFLGLEGRNPDGTLVLTSTLTRVGEILPGAIAEGDPAVIPGSPAWMTVVGEVQELKEQVFAMEEALWLGKPGQSQLPEGGSTGQVLAKKSDANQDAQWIDLPENGQDGYTPVKGTDYWTEADKQEILSELDISISVRPDYVTTGADSAVSRVIAAQGKRTFTFAAITDMHYGNGSYTAGVRHACQAMKYIDQRVKLDAVAVLGDYTDGYPADELSNAIGDFKDVNAVLNDLRFSPNLRLQGNHDYYAGNFPTTHRFIQAYSDDVVWGDKLAGYYYKDFQDYKLRIICVNTEEEGNTYLSVSTAQYNWFVGALDLSAKEDAADWQILVLSHRPLDWYVPEDKNYVFAYVLDAYQKGTSGTQGGISYDFTGGKNAATLIGNIHGHIHNLLTDYLHFGNINSGNKSGVLRMCTPEACYGRENQYSGGWAEDTAYPKTKDTVSDTSFCIYCIDLDSKTIKAICYGAGYDRAETYDGSQSGGGETGTYTNLIPKALDTDGVTILNGVGYKENARLSWSGSFKDNSGSCVTGYMPIPTSGTLTIRLKNITFDSGSEYTGAFYFHSAVGGTYTDSVAVGSSDFTNYYSPVYDSEGNLTQITTENTKGWTHLVVSAKVIDATSVVTVNEEID